MVAVVGPADTATGVVVLAVGGVLGFAVEMVVAVGTGEVVGGAIVAVGGPGVVVVAVIVVGVEVSVVVVAGVVVVGVGVVVIGTDVVVVGVVVGVVVAVVDVVVVVVGVVVVVAVVVVVDVVVVVVVSVVVVGVVDVVVVHNAWICATESPMSKPVLPHTGSELPALAAINCANHSEWQSQSQPLWPASNTLVEGLSTPLMSAGSDVSCVFCRLSDVMIVLPLKPPASTALRGLPSSVMVRMVSPLASPAAILAILLPDSMRAATMPGSFCRAGPGNCVSRLSVSMKAMRRELVKASGPMVPSWLWSMISEVMGTPVRKWSGRAVMWL